jgi:putative transposase
MGKNYQTETTRAMTGEVVVPDEVCVAMGELADAMREGLLAFAVGAGLQVMQVVMEENVIAICGPKGRHDPTRSAVRHGREDGTVVLGGRQLSVRRPRVRSADGSAEVAVPAYECSRTPRCWASWRWSG